MQYHHPLPHLDDTRRRGPPGVGERVIRGGTCSSWIHEYKRRVAHNCSEGGGGWDQISTSVRRKKIEDNSPSIFLNRKKYGFLQEIIPERHQGKTCKQVPPAPPRRASLVIGKNDRPSGARRPDEWDP